MTSYEIAKLVHILGTVLLFGTGMGTDVLSSDGLSQPRPRRHPRHGAPRSHRRLAVHHARSRDAAGPGATLMLMLGYRFDTVWFAAVVILFALTGACWIPVVLVQYRLRDLAADAKNCDSLPADFHV